MSVIVFHKKPFPDIVKPILTDFEVKVLFKQSTARHDKAHKKHKLFRAT